MKKISLFLFLTIITFAAAASAQTPATKQPAPQPPAPAEPKKDDCGCEAKMPPDVLADVNGVRITMKDIDEPIKAKIDELQRQVVEARKREVDLQINSKLLEADARKRGISAAKILELEIVSKVKDPTEAEVQAFYDQNKSRIQAEFKDVRADIVSYLRDRQQQQEAGKLAERLRAAYPVKVIVQVATPPATEADRARVFAEVNGERITSGDVEDSLKPLIFSVQEQVYNMRKNQLDLKINDTLLEQEAQKRKITTRALIDAEITPKVKTVSETDAQKFYEENKDRINGDYAQIKPQIIQYLQRQQQLDAESSFADQLRKTGAVKMFLTEPEPPVYKIATDDQPSKGVATAAVTIVEFTDFQCPSCAKTQPVLEEIVKLYDGKVRLVVRDYPLSQHANAKKAAEAAEAAREQGKYWEYTALLFQNQTALEVAKLKEYATQLGLDRKKFDEALDSGRFSQKVQRDMEEGTRLGVNSTPTVFINGRRVRDKDLESLKATVDAELKGAKK